MAMTGDVKCWRSEMMGEVGVRQLMRDDRWKEIRRVQRYQDVMSSYKVEISSSKSMNDCLR